MRRRLAGKAARIAALLMAMLATLGMLPGPSHAQSKDGAQPMPPFLVQEGQLKGVEPPVWQMISMIRIERQADLNPRFNQLLGALLQFVERRGEGASGVALLITAEEPQHELIGRAVGTVLDEAGKRGNAAQVARLKVSVTLNDPVTKKTRSFEFRRKQ